MDEVSSLEFITSAWQAETTKWDMILQSNGFSGCEPVLDDDGNLAHYNHWSRFVIKQTHEKLRPKHSFTRHHATSSKLASPNVPIHGPHSIPHGWEWCEMGFFVHWTPPSSTIVLCFDLPQHFQILVKLALTSSADKINFSDPYSIFAVVLHELLSLYDNSVWSIRNHICNWEAARQQEPDYSLLHEIARHAIHVSETLAVASDSAKELQQQRQDFMMLHDQSKSSWRRAHSPLQFSLQILNGLLARSESNKARLQNETQLRDSKIQVRIGEEAKKETTAMKAIAVITMTFLPATFVSVRAYDLLDILGTRGSVVTANAHSVDYLGGGTR
ncbi:hypothetical protein DL770_009958 [Monosporascus sp. CRB-9-2]|nr:hypothetical protein DL770_009958 [Monosporascus sp. CRB-9-2]